MKKILTLTLLFAAALSAKAQISSLSEITTDKAYTLRNPHFNAYAVYNADKSTSTLWAAGMTASNAVDDSYKAEVDLTSPATSWMIVSYNNQWYVYNIGAQKFLTVGYNPVTAATAQAKLEDTPKAVEFTQNPDGGFHLRTYTDGAQNYLCAAPQLSYPISIWNSNDNGATWEIKENDLVEADYAGAITRLQEALPEMVNLTIDTRHGYVWSNSGNGAMPNQIRKGQPYTCYVQGLAGWHCPEGVVVTSGDQEYTISDIQVGSKNTAITIPAEMTTSDVTISGIWERSPKAAASARVLVFSDEFDGEGEPDNQYWVRTPRHGATWNRFCSNSPLVVYRNGGYLSCLAMRNPSQTDEDPGNMITGGVQTAGKFDVCYGRIEARVKTKAHSGNFPAFWMMPTDNSKGWPNAGEIDIWEAINTEDRAYGTIHSQWACCTKPGSPQHGSSIGGVDYDLWHIFTMEWSETALKWYVDGNLMYTYSKSDNQADLDNGQWPFDKPFYLILNQSVGNGGWAANPDLNFTYETLFDWVRVYQRGTDVTPVDHLPAATPEADSHYYDLQGRRLTQAPSKGTYIHGGRLIMK